MSKIDWSKVRWTMPDPGAVTELREYEPPPRKVRTQRSKLTPAEATALLERSEAIRLKAVAKKRAIEAAGGKWTGTKKDRVITTGKSPKRKP